MNSMIAASFITARVFRRLPAFAKRMHFLFEHHLALTRITHVEAARILGRLCT